VYAVLMIADIYLLKKFAVAGPEGLNLAPTSKGKKVRSTANSY
jgi:hypothetical protein